MTIYNLHARDTKNVGDLNCAAGRYFDCAGAVARDVSFEVQAGDTFILGGGGLLHPDFREAILRNIQRKPEKIIVWGIGTNTRGLENAVYPDWFEECSLIGIRDYGTKYRWVPCPSCMNPAFDSNVPVQHEVVVYAHAAVNNIPRIQAPIRHNVGSTLEEVLRFLGSAEYVVTNTYHGAYWATLLGRKVIVYPFSSRHLWTKYDYPLLESVEPWTKGKAEARTYPTALNECREANRLYFADVLSLLEK